MPGGTGFGFGLGLAAAAAAGQSITTRMTKLNEANPFIHLLLEFFKRTYANILYVEYRIKRMDTRYSPMSRMP